MTMQLLHTKRMQQYFVANAVSEDRHWAMLLSACGPAAYQLIKGLVASEKPTAKMFKELVQLAAKWVRSYYTVKTTVISED